MTNGEEVISLQLEGSNLSIFPPLLYSLFYDGDELGSILQALSERKEKIMKFVVVGEWGGMMDLGVANFFMEI